MAQQRFDDGVAVVLRATGEAATVVRLFPANGADPEYYYEVRRDGGVQSEIAAEGALLAADAAPSAPDASPDASPDAALDASLGEQEDRAGADEPAVAVTPAVADAEPEVAQPVLPQEAE